MTIAETERTAAAGRTGIACAAGAAIAFSGNDMIVKLFSAAYPLYEIIFVRSVVALILTVAVIAPLLEGERIVLRTGRLRLHVIRGLCVVGANLLYFTAIPAMPLANAAAIFFVAPLLITGLSVVLLGEKVGPRRWAAVAAGLIGVLVIIRPTPSSFQIAAILPLLSALCYAFLHIFTRRLGSTERASTMAVYIQMTFIAVSGGCGLALGHGGFAGSADPSLDFLLRAWVWPPAGDLAIMVLLGALSGAGGYLITQAYRIAEAGLIAPFEYLALIMSVFWGFAVFGEIPTLQSASGITLVLGSGLYLAFREAGLGKRPSVRRASARR